MRTSFSPPQALAAVWVLSALGHLAATALRDVITRCDTDARSKEALGEALLLSIALRIRHRNSHPLTSPALTPKQIELISFMNLVSKLL